MSGLMADGPHDQDASWPPELQADYERLRPLGQGAFGVVWLAKTRKNSCSRGGTSSTIEEDSEDGEEEDASFGSSRSEHHECGDGEHDGDYVAVKMIDISDEDTKTYALREISILSEINHPCIIRCLNSVSIRNRRMVVMSLADGPDLQELVDEGGALSISLCRLAARHLISAVAYLHARGVIHRDIKPANCILAKAKSTQCNQTTADWLARDEIWDDNATFDENEFKVILVDFGFAKAFSPKEIGLDKSSQKGHSVRNLVDMAIQRSGKDTSSHYIFDQSNHSNRSESKRISTRNTLSKSVSSTKLSQSPLKTTASIEHKPMRAMSALGSRAFAAPEVKKVRKKSDGENAGTEMVSDYGLIVDAFSIGATVRVLLTGVPADSSEMDYIGSQDNLLINIARFLFSCGKGGGKRRRRFKFLNEVPKQARGLVTKLMKANCAERISVPLAREEDWIKGGMNAHDPVVTLPVGDVPAGNNDPIKCLKCAENGSQ